MKWVNGISAAVVAFSAATFVIAEVGLSAGNGVSSALVVDGDGQTARIDTLLPAAEIGLISAGETNKAEDNTRNSSTLPPAGSACVNINTADHSQLMTLKGIGPSTAAKIVEHRTANGRFRKKEDIKNVKGIGPSKYAQIADHICL